MSFRASARCLFAVAVLVTAMPACAVQPDEMLPDPALEQRARTLSRELRCMVCQNQSIDDSEAPLARDLRLLVRDRLKKGDTNQQVLDFLVARYGQFVLLKPRFGWDTALLWLAPVGVLLVGAASLIAFIRRRRNMACREDSEPGLTEDERRRLNNLLAESGEQAPGRPS